MEKDSKNFRASDLIIDVLEYTFTEWLVRQKAFTAFKANYWFFVSRHGSFRKALRAHIRYVLRNPDLDLTHLISSAFSFASTPEGYDFWRKHSIAWRRFCTKFQSKL